MGKSYPRIICSWILLATIVSIVSASDGTFEALLERIDRLEERDRAQQTEINRLEERDHLQLKIIAHLEERDRLQKNEIDFLSENVTIQKEEIRNLRQQLLVQKTNKPLHSDVRYGQVETHKSLKHDEIVTKPVELASRNIQNQRKSSMSRIRRAENEMDVAFFATLTNHQMHVGVDQPIMFDHVVTNFGNGYHNHLGSFIAPVSGTYVFSVSLLTWAQHAHYTFSKNGTVVSKLYLDATKSGYESTSQTIIITLNQNEDVTIRNGDLDAHTHGGYSTFAGFLLYQHYPAIVG